MTQSKDAPKPGPDGRGRDDSGQLLAFAALPPATVLTDLQTGTGPVRREA